MESFKASVKESGCNRVKSKSCCRHFSSLSSVSSLRTKPAGSCKFWSSQMKRLKSRQMRCSFFFRGTNSECMLASTSLIRSLAMIVSGLYFFCKPFSQQLQALTLTSRMSAKIRGSLLSSSARSLLFWSALLARGLALQIARGAIRLILF